MKVKREQCGYTMIETIIYIGFIIILGGWIMSLGNTVYKRYKIGRTAQQIMDLRKAILNYTAADEDYSNLSIENMNRSSSLPSDMRTGNITKAKHALGGNIQIGPTTKYMHITSSEDKATHKYMFYIIFENLDRKSCAEILTQGQFYSDGANLDTLIVNGNTDLSINIQKGKGWHFKNSIFKPTKISDVKLWNANQSSSVVNEPTLSVGEALDACSEKNNNSITWIFS